MGGFAVLGGGLDMAFFHQLTNYDPAIQFGGLGIAVGAYASFASTVAYRMRVREQMHVINDVQDTSVTNLPLNQ